MLLVMKLLLMTLLAGPRRSMLCALRQSFRQSLRQSLRLGVIEFQVHLPQTPQPVQAMRRPL